MTDPPTKPPPGDPMRAALRLARSAPTVMVAQIAQRSRLAPGETQLALRRSSGPGRCGQLAAEAMIYGGPSSAHRAAPIPERLRAGVMAHPACGPGQRRLAAFDVSEMVRNHARGSAGFTARDPASGELAPHPMSAAVRGSVAAAVRAAVAGGASAAPKEGQGMDSVAAASSAMLRWASQRNDSPVVAVAVDTAAACGSDTLWRLSQHPHPLVRFSTAEAPRCPPPALGKLLADHDYKIRSAAGCNPRCPGDDTAAAMGASAPAQARLAASASPQMLRRLATSTDTEVRAAVASNPACPSETLDDLTQDARWQVRAAAVDNPAITDQALRRAAREVNWAPRAAAARNAACPHATAAALAQDNEPYVPRSSSREPRRGCRHRQGSRRRHRQPCPLPCS